MALKAEYGLNYLASGGDERKATTAQVAGIIQSIRLKEGDAAAEWAWRLWWESGQPGGIQAPPVKETPAKKDDDQAALQKQQSRRVQDATLQARRQSRRVQDATLQARRQPLYQEGLGAGYGVGSGATPFGNEQVVAAQMLDSDERLAAVHGAWRGPGDLDLSTSGAPQVPRANAPGAEMDLTVDPIA